MLSKIRNKLTPFQARGRWYKFFIESDGIDYKITQSDLEGTDIVTTYLRLPSGYHVLQVIGDVHSIEDGSASNAFVPRFFQNDRQGCMLPAKNTFDAMTVYVFAYNGGD